MGKQVLATNNYSKFEMHPLNRDQVPNNRKLEASMKRLGFLDCCPMHVVRNGVDGKLLIKQGHQRFLVAQKLNLPVKYVEMDDDATIFELESGTNWKVNDYLSGYVRLGKKEYIDLKEYCDDTGISRAVASALLRGHSTRPSSAAFERDFKEGRYKINRDSQLAATVQTITDCMRANGVATYRSAMMVLALAKIVLVPKFETNRFLKKIKTYGPQMIGKRATLDQQLDMLEALYNHMSQGKLPLKFLAIQEAKNRNPVKKGKNEKNTR
jgi:hypothetical protein